MNLIGKIFVVAIFVLSLVFMSFSMAVYSTHKNWRDATAEYQTKLKKAEHDLSDKQAERDTLEKTLKDEVEAKRSALTAAENKLASLQKDYKELEAQKSDLEQKQRDAVAAMSATQANAKASRDELERQRQLVIKTAQERDAMFKLLREKTTEYDQAADAKAVLERRTGELGKDLAKAEKLRIEAGLDKVDVTKTAPKIDAIVTQVTGDGVCEISLGSDAGLQKGHVLYVYRVGQGRNDYVGRIEVVRTTPTSAACKYAPQDVNSKIQRNDRVVSKISN